MAEDRRAGRVLLVDPDGAVLLVLGFDPGEPEAGTWWITPGGGADPGEAIEVTGAREVFEETGLELSPDDLGPVVANRVAVFDFDGRTYRQSESFFAVQVQRFEPVVSGWEEVEQRSLLELRWWTADELERTHDTVYPKELAVLLRAFDAGTLRAPMVLSGE